ncbi:GNAT family N-acetyltransferase [Neptunicella marina]|uniref:GNAT family N-acetyltransferase n=1 Tax=Neptunicella marina TaxID=2125989 RepID=A0A8J6IPJ0_9ALTE|nr:GNAT family N-acetyltransferase [Neptunicella marina]MBC3764294.1 GNAT family N-acetyltransferase [Neptunicella marina]
MTFRAKSVDWKNAKDKLTQLREKVFVCEWRIPREVEFDQQDPQSFHVLVMDEKHNAIATGRITPKGEVGRIAVVSRCRQTQVYQTLFDALMKIARKHQFSAVTVQCELDGIIDYQQQGFRPVGSVFMDAGIARQRMTIPVKKYRINHLRYIH